MAKTLDPKAKAALEALASSALDIEMPEDRRKQMAKFGGLFGKYSGQMMEAAELAISNIADLGFALDADRLEKVLLSAMSMSEKLAYQARKAINKDLDAFFTSSKNFKQLKADQEELLRLQQQLALAKKIENEEDRKRQVEKQTLEIIKQQEVIKQTKSRFTIEDVMISRMEQAITSLRNAETETEREFAKARMQGVIDGQKMVLQSREELLVKLQASYTKLKQKESELTTEEEKRLVNLSAEIRFLREQNEIYRGTVKRSEEMKGKTDAAGGGYMKNLFAKSFTGGLHGFLFEGRGMDELMSNLGRDAMGAISGKLGLSKTAYFGAESEEARLEKTQKAEAVMTAASGRAALSTLNEDDMKKLREYRDEESEDRGLDELVEGAIEGNKQLEAERLERMASGELGAEGGVTVVPGAEGGLGGPGAEGGVTVVPGAAGAGGEAGTVAVLPGAAGAGGEAGTVAVLPGAAGAGGLTVVPGAEGGPGGEGVLGENVKESITTTAEDISTLTKEATTPGSLYTHDIHAERILKDIYNFLVKGKTTLSPTSSTPIPSSGSGGSPSMKTGGGGGMFSGITNFLGAIADGVKKFGDKEVWKGAFGLALVGASLIPFAFALSIMSQLDAMGVLVAVGAMYALVGLLFILGKIPIKAILIGAAALLVIGVTMALVGASLLMAGAGIMLFAMAFERVAAIPFSDLLKVVLAIGVAVGMMAVAIGVLGILAPLAPLALFTMLTFAAGIAVVGLATKLLDTEKMLALSTTLTELASSAGGLITAAAGLWLIAAGIVAFAGAVLIGTGILGGAKIASAIGSWLGLGDVNILDQIIGLAQVGDKLMQTANALQMIADAIGKISTSLASMSGSQVGMEMVEKLISLDATQIKTLQDVSIAMEKVMSTNEKLKGEAEAAKMGQAVGAGGNAAMMVNNNSSVGSSTMMLPMSGRMSDPSILFSSARYHAMTYR